jgi:hypothetical protein
MRRFATVFRMTTLPMALALAGASVGAGVQLPINDRIAVATAVIKGSRGRYDGSFSLNGKAGICGEMPAAIVGEPRFVVEFSSATRPTNGSISSVAFGSSQLVGKVTSASVFRLNVTVVTSNGGRPPAYVLNTDGKNPRNTGTATLTQKGSSTVLVVKGQNDMGEVIELEVTCG